MVDTATNLDKFFDSLEGDNDDVDSELADALAQQAADEDDDNKDDTKNDGSKDDATDDDDHSKLSLEERLSLIEKENKGLKKDIVKVRETRRSAREEAQEARDRYNRLHGMIEQMAQGSPAKDALGEKDPMKDLKLSVEYDDDGNPYVPADALAELIKGQDSKLEETKAAIAQREARTQEETRLQRTIDSIVSKDAEYPNALRTVEEALADMNQRVIDIQKDKNITGILQPGVALDLLEQEGGLDEWKEKFPELDPDIIVNAFQSKRQLNSALAFVKGLNKAGDNKIDDNNKAKKSLQDAAIQDKLSKKPATHGKGGTEAKESIVAKVGSSSAEDILNLNDKDVARLLARMRQEELESY